MVEKSEVKIMTDDKELGLFLASTLTREEVERLNLEQRTSLPDRMEGAEEGPN